jgi:hypothetical protein
MAVAVAIVVPIVVSDAVVVGVLIHLYRAGKKAKSAATPTGTAGADHRVEESSTSTNPTSSSDQ